jgi:large subunit ribosomal protein L30
MSEAARIRVRWVRSAIGYDRHQRVVLRGLGLRRLNQCVELEDTPSIRGMVAAVSHLIRVEEG